MPVQTYVQCLSKGLSYGGVDANLVEPQKLTVNRFYEVLWKKQEIDLTVLAKLRWIDKWSIERLAKHFDLGTTAIKCRLKALKSKPKLASIIPKKNV